MLEIREALDSQAVIVSIPRYLGSIMMTLAYWMPIRQCTLLFADDASWSHIVVEYHRAMFM